MEFLRWLFAIVSAGLAGFFGHLAAHDFCERSPTMARWIIAQAVAILSEEMRVRYSEEWLAHLAECDGVIAALAHAVGCVRCARKMNRQRLKAIVLRVGFNFKTVGPVTFRTNAYELGIALWLFNIFTRTKMTSHLMGGAMLVFFFRRLYREAHNSNGVTLAEFLQFCTTMNAADFAPISLRLKWGEQDLDLLRLLRACGHSIQKTLETFLEALTRTRTQSALQPPQT